MDIKEIALKVARKVDPDFQGLPSDRAACEFAEALIAELAKQNEPLAWCVGYDDPRMGRIHSNPTMCKPEAEALVKSTTSELIVCSLYALPPTAEQIANETAWQPIETAPKDGSWVLGWRQHATRPRLIQFDTDYEEWANEDGEHVYAITRWMPLPTPPKRSMEGV